MVTDLNPFSVTSPILPARAAGRVAQVPDSTFHSRLSRLNPNRLERESSFERAHGSLWEPGLLDRLTAPLTRYHE